jgi:ADP-heptose:LPS heptosyltransferase
LTSRRKNSLKKFFDENDLDNKLTVALIPVGTWETKRWELKKFAELGDIIAKNFNAEILIIWGNEKEFEEAMTISSFMNAKPIIPPRTSLKQLSAILKRCSFAIANDSGPMHISAVVGNSNAWHLRSDESIRTGSFR